MRKEIGDWSTQAGARALAQRIRLYWLERGFEPKVTVEPMVVALNIGDDEDNDRTRIWCVRSDIGLLLPKLRKATAA